MNSAFPRFTRLLVGGFLLLWVETGLGAGLALTLLPEDNPEVRANIQAYLGEIQPRNTREMRRYSRFARGEISKALEALGYYQYQLQLQVIEGDPATLEVRVEPGERVLLGQVSLGLEGEALQQADFTLPSGRLVSGHPLNHSDYEAAKRHFRNQALSYGYFASRFTRQELLVDPDAGVADVFLHFDSGPRYRLGEVTFQQQGSLDEDFLQTFVGFVAGMPYSSQQLSQLSRDLRESGYFEEVFVDADPDRADDNLHLPVDVSLKAREPRTLNLGLGFSTDTGPRASANWVEHWVNEQGLRRGVDAQISQPEQTLGGWYEFPLDPPMTDKLRVSSDITREVYDDQESRRYGASLQWFYKHANGWERVLSLRGEREEYYVGEDRGATWLTLPGLSYGFLQTDRRIDPTQGYRLQVDMEGSRESILADVDIFQLRLMARGLVTLLDRHRLLARLRLGATATNEFERVPLSMRFFAGGDQSLRGYDYQELSPLGDDGRQIGGRYLMTTGVEYQWVVNSSWRLAVFADGGNAVAEPQELKEPKWGVGFGIRWVSPVGPLRLDLAESLDDELGGTRLHLTLGPEI
ncbi:autotransporter assembly complex protein TamA [Marinospirillum perlucidum]|uniref:autotransporter assembly complex protein TamA n=1 Tax=Marinospirillum perlucidum TaxID=1982602 RepID=UPI00138FA8D8|nr:autotransporter assembly complex family protein [Marinospirillum perlucidum]